MSIHPQAGQPVPRSGLLNISELVSSYYTSLPKNDVSFGTSGHRGTSLKGTFTASHIAATTQAICDYRQKNKIKGPLFLGFDTHALSVPAFRTTLEVLAANDVETVIHKGDQYTPTPVISFLILEHNRTKKGVLADGIVITPSHNPPQDGGFKYNPTHGGPADVDVTQEVQTNANQLMAQNLKDVKRLPYEKARRAHCIHEDDFITPFVISLSRVVDMESIKNASIRMGVDPMGGSGIHFWEPIAEHYKLNLEIVNDVVDPTFWFMPLDADGIIRMDCSSAYAMTNLISLKDKYDIAWGNDPDYDRHGIVCPTGLMNPNHYLSVAIWYLLQHRPLWDPNLMIGKTLVSSTMIDKVVSGLNRKLFEVPVGFKWFVDGLLNETIGFGGEESAGASFLRMDQSTWTTDKDGFALTLLAAEILAKTGKSPADIYTDILVSQYGNPYYRREDGPVTTEQKQILASIDPEAIIQSQVAGLKITSAMTKSPGNGAPIGGVKVNLEDGSWFAIRPSGTEPKMKFYIESFGGEMLWQQIRDQGYNLIFNA